MTLVMGIVNVTPDSFSDGGKWASTQAAIDHARELLTQGAHIVDIGGESTRPGAARVSEEEEIARVVPVISGLAGAPLVSVDTMRARVAEAAVAAGAKIINDVSGGQADPDILHVAAASDVDYVLMHWRGHSCVMSNLASYGCVVADVRAELLAQLERALGAGIQPERIIVDVGLGFAKDTEHNWALLRHIGEFNKLGYRQLVGASRKRFLGELTSRPAPERDAGSAAISAWCAGKGVWAVRTHSVADHVDAIAVAKQLAKP